jgi:hypothetical protein
MVYWDSGITAVAGILSVDSVSTPETAAMARKKPETPKMLAPIVTDEPRLVLIKLQLLEAERDEFRILAAKERTNMALLARRVVRDYIASKRKEVSK